MTTDELITELYARVGEKYPVEDEEKCWTFVWESYKKLGVELPGEPVTAAHHFRRIEWEDRKPLDAAYFSHFGKHHVGLVISRHEMFHVADDSYGLCTARLASLRPEIYRLRATG